MAAHFGAQFYLARALPTEKCVALYGSPTLSVCPTLSVSKLKPDIERLLKTKDSLHVSH